jgi:hypothetical protein
MTPLDELDTVATPLVKVIAVVRPKLTAVPEEFVTLGVKDPIAEAPPKVRLWEPVKLVAVLPYWSRAVIVRLSPAPAVGVVVIPERVRLVAAAPGFTVTLRVELLKVGDVAAAVMLAAPAL